MGENTKDKSQVEVKIDPANSHVSAFVFKTFVDPYAGRVNLFRVITGVMKADHSLLNLNKGTSERISTISVLQGKTASPVQEVHAGDIASVAKLKDTQTNDTLADPASSIRYSSITFPNPIISFAIEPKSRGDEEKISTALHKMADEDPVLRFERDQQTKELLVSGSGQLHVEVVVARLKRRFGVEVLLHQPKVPYRETITAKAEGHHRHKKQTGGAGQFGEVFLRVEPLKRGAGFEFVDQVKGGTIPTQFIPAVEKGVRQVLEAGPVAGFPVHDVRVIVYDGKHHEVDSKEVAFIAAGKRAFMDAISKARTIILEPIVNIEITAPENAMGDIAGDISSKRGQLSGTDSITPGTLVIRGLVPLAELNNYQARLKSVTAGQGSYAIEFARYEPVPPSIQKNLSEQHAKTAAHAEEQ